MACCHFFLVFSPNALLLCITGMQLRPLFKRGEITKIWVCFLRETKKLQKHWVSIYLEAVMAFDIISCWPLSLVASKAFRCNILKTRDEAKTEKRAKCSLLMLLHHTPVHVHVACALVWPFFHPQLASSLTSTSGINTITTIKENSIDFFHFCS